MPLTIFRERWISFLFCLLPGVVAAQPSSKIYLLDMSFSKDNITLSAPRVVTDHKGYNNQPFFHSSLPLLYYSSADDSGKSDIRYYNYETKATQNLTVTPESEYSPALTPDGQFISCVVQRANGHQDLAKYPVKGGQPVVLIDNLKIGYYGWTGNSTLLLFVLQPKSFELHYYDLATKRDSLLPIKPGRCFVKVPGEDAMSFMDKTDSAKWIIKKWIFRTGKIETVAGAPAMHEDFTWTKNGLLITINGDKLVFYDPKANTGNWKPIEVTGYAGDIKKITRLAVNAANNRLAIVVDDK